MKRYLHSLILLLILVISLNASVAKITSLSGNASIERGNKSLVATLGSNLEAKDIVATLANSKTQLTFKDNTIITVGKQSRFSIEEYLFDSSNSSNVKFNVLSGTVRAMSGKIGKIAPDKFVVKTKTATIGIRGTDFVVHVADDGTISIFCLQGAIIVRNANGHEVSVNVGSYVTLSPNGTIDGPNESTPSEINQLLEAGFFITRTTQGNSNVEFTSTSEPVIAAEGTNEILHPDESLERGNLPNIEDVLADAGITISTDSVTEAIIPNTTTPQTYTGIMTSFFKYNYGNYLKEGTLTLTSDPSTQTVTGSIYVPAIYSTFHLGSTNTYTDVNSFDIQLASIEDSYSNIVPLLSSSYLKTCACSSEDYFAWGEWEKTMSVADPYDYKVHGYWIAGIETLASVLDTYRTNLQSLTYTGTTNAEVNTLNATGDLMSIGSFYGTSTINVDFGNDTFAANFQFSNISDTYNLSFSGNDIGYYNNKLESTTIDALSSNNHGDFMSQIPGGHLHGGFYGSQGKTVGGIYNVETPAPSSSDSLVIQGAFHATAP